MDNAMERIAANEKAIEFLTIIVQQLRETDFGIGLILISGLGAIAMLVFKNKDK